MNLSTNPYSASLIESESTLCDPIHYPQNVQTMFLKSWIWAMPERAQQLGLMVYRVVDDVTWIEVASDLPEVIPRGLPGHRRYY